MMSVYQRLQAMDIVLPPITAPAASYAPYLRAGQTLYLSGHLARRDGAVWTGRLGDEISLEEGRSAARATAIDLLATLQHASGNLEIIARIVKMTVMVASRSNFFEQHLVANGASELFGEVFPAAGPHTRSAFGVVQLPLRACVEIELIAELAAPGSA
ncbi:Enamine deaminase RidA, house cleaning of reactive enamine intermediates, YjgF/YER057c/UK114 family [Bradyrhizobium erythrophlei]|uniref:Enamine deaminase RidA, house cleaning of reactive enamine intermediates, YjgF/YER057c/UK114 family n=2 Tax=Bradyrhizobium erythrophlei TaxID=1437360 RepID=A0A1H4X6P6_9BRAD|nr:Enamine deaminase RidA, house cleaning of reactive enamine intermediates, YjgF/YER057c/UK114 family [Bradyrhizobium erythrophlei]